VVLTPLISGDSNSDNTRSSEKSGIYRRSDSVPVGSRSGSNTSTGVVADSHILELESAIEELQKQNVELNDRLQKAEQNVSQLSESMQSLRRELGCN